MRTKRPSNIRMEELPSPIQPAISPQEAGKGAKARKTKLAVMGLSAGLLDAGDPRYAACIRLANSFRKARTKEMYELHGHVSTGVSALLASSAMALAAARFLYEVAASTEEGRPDLLAKAAKLSDSSRQNELSAWELCSRESIIRHRHNQAASAIPWLTGGKEPKFGPAGNEYTGPSGRPRKAKKAMELLPSPSGDQSHAGHTQPEGPIESPSPESSGHSVQGPGGGLRGPETSFEDS